MRRKLIVSIAGLVLGAFASSTAAAQTLEYDCDTQAEHYSVLKTKQDGPAYSAGGHISLREVFSVRKYATLGALEFAPEDRSWRVRIGMTALKVDNKVIVTGSLAITRNGKADEPRPIGQIFDFQVGKDYPIQLEMNGATGTAKLGSETLAFELPAKDKLNVSVVCSGGEFLFTDLNLGK